MKKKKLFLIVFALFLLLVSIDNIQADYCTECAAGGTPCGSCGLGCEINSDGVCVENDEIVGNKVNCGNITGIPKKIPELTSYAISVIQIAVPIVLVVLGSIDLFKGVSAQKEDEMKKGQQMFIKRLIYGAIIFFVVVIIKFLISILADSTTSDNIVDCVDCFISGDC